MTKEENQNLKDDSSKEKLEENVNYHKNIQNKENEKKMNKKKNHPKKNFLKLKISLLVS